MPLSESSFEGVRGFEPMLVSGDEGFFQDLPAHNPHVDHKFTEPIKEFTEPIKEQTFIPTNEACKPCYYSVMLGMRMFCRAENPYEPIPTKGECRYGEPMVESGAFLIPQSALIRACENLGRRSSPWRRTP